MRQPGESHVSDRRNQYGLGCTLCTRRNPLYIANYLAESQQAIAARMHIKKMNLRFPLPAFVLLLSPGVAPVAAQDVAEARIEEVYVSARRREENLQRVPVAVSVFDEQALELMQVEDITDLSRAAPNVVLTETGGATAGSLSAFIRGIGGDTGQDPGVGIYLDDVYLSRPSATLLRAYNIERVEILRGPQGHLYGRNTIGGAVRFITRQPTEEMHASLEATIGTEGIQRFRGDLAGPITDTLAGTLGFYLSERDPLQTDRDDGAQYWDESFSAVRGRLNWSPGEQFAVSFAADYFLDDSTPRLPARIAVDTASATFSDDLSTVITAGNEFFGDPALGDLAVRAGLVEGANDPYVPGDPDEVWTEFGDAFRDYKLDALTASVTVDWDINESWTLRSITAYRDSDFDANFDLDGSAQQYITTRRLHDDRDFTQEFQLQFTADNINGVLGAFYLDGDQSIDDRTLQYPRLLVTRSQDRRTDRVQNDVESKAVYFNVDWEFAPRWELSVGGRYTDESKSEDNRATVSQEIYAIALSGPGVELPPGFPFFPAWVDAGDEAAVERQGPAAGFLPPESATFGGWATLIPGLTELLGATNECGIESFDRAVNCVFPSNTLASDSYTDFSPSIRLAWEPVDDLMVYGGYASSFKAGGFNQTSGSAQPYDPEKIDSVFLGVKTQFADARVVINAEIFYNDYTDKQLTEVTLVDGVLIQFVGNVGELETTGAEIEWSWFVTNGLKLSGSLGLLDNEIASYVTTDPATGESLDLSGTTGIGYSPEVTAHFAADYFFGTDFGDFRVGGNIAYTDEFFTRAQVALDGYAAAEEIAESNTTLNAYLGFTSPSERWEAVLEGTNLTDERVRTNSFQVGPFTTGSYTLPRLVMFTLRYIF